MKRIARDRCAFFVGTSYALRYLTAGSTIIFGVFVQIRVTAVYPQNLWINLWLTYDF
jgi:hypothetical protein